MGRALRGVRRRPMHPKGTVPFGCPLGCAGFGMAHLAVWWRDAELCADEGQGDVVRFCGNWRYLLFGEGDGNNLAVIGELRKVAVVVARGVP